MLKPFLASDDRRIASEIIHFCRTNADHGQSFIEASTRNKFLVLMPNLMAINGASSMNETTLGAKRSMKLNFSCKIIND